MRYICNTVLLSSQLGVPFDYCILQLWYLGQTASYEEIIKVLETQYDDVAEGEVLLSELFSTTQGEKESLTEFASRLESILYQLSKLDGSRYSGGDLEILKVNFFRGLRNDSVREAL